MQKEKIKVYTYTRVSTAMQVDGYSLDAQKAKMKAYADYNDYEIVGEYEDAGKSGKSIEGRAQFSQMMEDIKSGKDGVSYVLVFKLSRFGRNAADVLSSLQVMQDFGVNLVCVEDGIDSSKDAGKLMISVLSAVAEIERENIRVQTMEGRIQKAREGRWNGGFAPYGYQLVDGKLMINEEEAEAIRVIYDQYVHTDIGANGIAKYLENHGIRKIPRQNGKNPLFDAHLIRLILKNPVYCGKIAYGRRKMEKVRGTRNEYKLVEQDNYLLADGLHEPIVSEEVWQAAQVKLLAQAKKYEHVNRGKDEHVHLLSGIVKCPVCGAGMYGNKSIKHKADGTKYKDFYYYGCKHRSMIRGHKCDYKKQIREELLDDAVAEVIVRLVSNPKFAAMMQEKINMKVDTAAIDQEIANCEKQLRQHYSVKAKLTEEIDSLDPDDRHYVRRKADLDDRLYKMYDKIEDTESLLIAARAKKQAIEAEKLTGDNIYKVLIYFEKLYGVMNEAERRQLIEVLISEIQVYPERQANGQWLKSIKFKLPIIEEDMSISLDNEEQVEEYIVTGENSTEVVGNENGNWLKVIGNDGDGEAEYVLKTIYTAAGVEDINRDGDIELTPLYITLDSTDDLNQLTKDIPVVTADELAEGDVVYYAVIDGNAQTYLADMVTAEIDRVNRNTLTATTTDGDEYIQSDVHNHVDWAGYDDGVRNLEGDVSYDLYLDKYGYLMVFTETAYSGNFALLTDGWFMSQRSGDEYAAMVWNGEDLVDTDITSGGSLFIYDDRNDNDWDNLKAFEDINDNGSAMLTIVAALNEDGELVPVEDSTNTRDIRIIATDDNVIPGRDYETGDAYITGTNDRTAYDTIDSTNAEVRALSSTVYYYVYEESGDTIVDEYVGYANLPSLYDDDLALIEDVYVVGTRENRESNLGNATYYTANVVVVEFTRSYRANAEQVFIYDTPVVGNSVKLEDVDMIRADGTMDTVTIDLTKSVGATYDPAGEKRINPGLYYMWATNDEGVYVVERMSALDIADNRYAVGQVSTSLATMDSDWVEVRQWNVTGETSEYDTYGYVADSSKTYTLDYSVEQYNWNDIWYLEAHMAEADAEDVLDEQVDISRDRDAAQANQDSRGYWWNNNDVLIAYNGDGDIIYAVSFNNYDTYTAAEMAYLALRQDVDYAQDVWGSLMPSTYTAAPEVTFYGQPATVNTTNNTITGSATYGEAVDNEALDPDAIVVENGSIVVGDKVTNVDPNGDTYTGTILGTDGEYYSFTLTQDAQSTDLGELVSADHDVVQVITANDGTQTWKVTNENTTTLKSFADLLSATEGCKVQITALDSNGENIAAADFDNFVVANAATLTVEIVNADYYSDEIAEESDATVKVMLGAGVTAYADAARTIELSVDSTGNYAYVVTNTTLYFGAEGTGTISATGGVSVSNGTVTDGVTNASASITAATTVSFTAQSVADANQAKLTAIQTALASATEIKAASTENDKAGIEAEVIPEIKKILEAAGIDTSDVTIEFSSGNALTGCDENEKTSGAAPQFTVTVGTASDAKSANIQVKTEFTHLYTEAELVAEINSTIARYTYSTTSYGNETLMANAVEGVIETVQDITTGTNIVVSNVTVTARNAWAATELADVTYTVVYNGVSYNGTTSITLA